MRTLKSWWHKLTHYEYWPFHVFYLPIYPYFLYLAIKHRSFFFFTASNPNIEFGGMLGEKKSDIYDLMPAGSYPKTELCPPDISGKEVLNLLHAHDISFPFIVKPNIGERGKGVERIENLPGLYRYLSKTKVDFLIQEYVHHPIELGIFYVRIPNQARGILTSITQKDFLSVIGDGKSTIEELLRKNTRATLTFNFDSADFKDIKGSIPMLDEQVFVEPIGNHSRGTAFLNVTEETSESLREVIDQVAKKVQGFYFGRLDIRCKSFGDLAENKNWSILEINGAGAEPGHIYQPGFGILNAYKEIIRHLNYLSKISYLNHKNGQQYWPFANGLAKIREIRAYNKESI